ncbi:hypothetical protein N752_15580 [Desulforamulus aquiferis]|nr:hypothetical protein [Desulforamulus aquiferis]RYD04263.1 hypothetical protein N752_15580 [Desulforamulus aquiferis]
MHVLNHRLLGGDSHHLVPSAAIGLAKQDAWLAPLLAIVPGLLLLSILLALTICTQVNPWYSTVNL